MPRRAPPKPLTLEQRRAEIEALFRDVDGPPLKLPKLAQRRAQTRRNAAVSLAACKKQYEEGRKSCPPRRHQPVRGGRRTDPGLGRRSIPGKLPRHRLGVQTSLLGRCVRQATSGQEPPRGQAGQESTARCLSTGCGNCAQSDRSRVTFFRSLRTNSAFQSVRRSDISRISGSSILGMRSFWSDAIGPKLSKTLVQTRGEIWLRLTGTVTQKEDRATDVQPSPHYSQIFSALSHSPPKSAANREPSVAGWKNRTGFPTRASATEILIHVPTAREWIFGRMRHPAPRRKPARRKSETAA